MIIRTLLFIAFISFQAGIFAQEAKVALTTILKDPLTVDPCNPIPTETSDFIDFDGTLLDQVWWEYVKRATNLPKKFRGNFKDKKCKKLYQPDFDSDKRRFYWQVSCPYTVHWLSRFTRKLSSKPFITETCYLLYPCRERIRIVNCTTTNCQTRCITTNPHIRNSVCLESNFEVHKNVRVFCTPTLINVGGFWQSVDCRRYPERCLKKVTIKAPQTCECWSCWDMHVTMPNKTDLMQRGKK